MEYDIDYKDDLSGAQKAELTFVNGESEVTFNGNVEEEKSCNGTMRVSKRGEDKPFKVGTYKLKEAKITDHSGKTTTYTLNQSGTKLTGEDAVLKSKKCEAIDETTYTFTYDTRELKKAFKGYYDFEGVILYDRIGNVEGVEYDYMTKWETNPISYELYAVRAGDMIPGYDLGDYYTDENSRIKIPEVIFDIESDDDSNEDPQPPVHNHTFKKVTVKASPGKDGKTYERCDECGATRNNKTISAPKTMTLSPSSYTYNAKKQTPKVKITTKNGSTISASNYTVTYPYSKNAGRYNVVVKFKGNYTGQMSKTFDILLKTTKLSKVTAGKKKATISKNKTVTTTIKSLKSKKKYYVRIRTYTKVKYNVKN